VADRYAGDGDEALEVADSAECLEDAELGKCACPCGNETLPAALGFAMTADYEVSLDEPWLTFLTDGTLGVYADWKAHYIATAHLPTTA
jgi:hypothetical protein